MIVDLEKTANLIAEIAIEEITPRFGKLTGSEINTKSSATDFVTSADLAAEARLASALSDIYPAATIIGEESVAADPAILDQLGDDGAFWIVDPLDGTRNFVQGRAEFGTIVALVEGGETRAGWIYAIPDQKMAMGALGDGASWDGERVSPAAEPEAPLAGYRAIGNLAEPWKSRLVPKLRSAFETAPAQCSAYAYINILRGLRDFSLYSRIQPWDHAAGILLLNEIGGKAGYLDDGAPYRPLPQQGRPLLVAGSEGRWRQVHDVITA